LRRERELKKNEVLNETKLEKLLSSIFSLHFDFFSQQKPFSCFFMLFLTQRGLPRVIEVDGGSGGGGGEGSKRVSPPSSPHNQNKNTKTNSLLFFSLFFSFFDRNRGPPKKKHKHAHTHTGGGESVN
jgi:hypothetical protein